MSKTPTQLYFLQRATGVVMMPLALWMLIYFLPQFGHIITKDQMSTEKVLYELFYSTINITLLILFTICSLYHNIIGCQSIIRDYISCTVLSKVANFILIGISLFIIVFLTILILDIHFKVVHYE